MQSSGYNKKQTSWSTTSQAVMRLFCLVMNPNLSLKWTEVSHIYFRSTASILFQLSKFHADPSGSAV